jgi:hypothetical protein
MATHKNTKVNTDHLHFSLYINGIILLLYWFSQSVRFVTDISLEVFLLRKSIR